MKKLIAILIIVVTAFVTYFGEVSFASSKESNGEIMIDGVDETLWQNTAGTYLKDDLWTEKNAYDACHYLMVPIHAAFLFKKHD